MSIFSDRLVALRSIHKKSHNEIAEYLNITRGAYTHYERGRREPDFDTLCRLADYFSVTPNYLLGFSEQEHLYSISNEEQCLLSRVRELPSQYQKVIYAVIQIALEDTTSTTPPQLIATDGSQYAKDTSYLVLHETPQKIKPDK